MPEDPQPERAHPEAVGAARQIRVQRRAGGRPGGIGRFLGLLGLLVAVVLGVVLLGPKLSGGPKPPSDFVGEGKEDIVIEVNPGDSGSVIAQNLVDSDVIADVGVFISAASGNAALAAIQPGFYQLRTEIPAATAVQKLTDPGSRVGKLVIPEGKQLDDITVIGSDTVSKGIFTLISEASCVDLNGTRKCVAAQDLNAAAEEGPLSSLNVPDWATEGAGVMGQSHRRLEGLIAPGTWNIDPSAAPKQILSNLVAESSAHYVKGGLLEAATTLNMSPYEVLIVGSLVQKEAQPVDFAKVARVIYNRLASDYDGWSSTPPSTTRWLARKWPPPTRTARPRRRGTPTPCLACRPPRSARRVMRRWRQPNARNRGIGCTSSPSVPTAPRSSRPTIRSIWRTANWR